MTRRSHRAARRPAARSGALATLVAVALAVPLGACTSTTADAPAGPPPATTTGAARPGPGDDAAPPIPAYGQAPDLQPVSAADARSWRRAVARALHSRALAGTTGVWVAVSVPGHGLWQAAVGRRSAGGPRAGLGDHLRIGSITKTFTAVAVLQQVARGRLHLHDTVAELLPDLAARHREVADLTVEQLLDMSSGLPDYANVRGGAFTQQAADPLRVWSPDELIDSALEAGVVEPPGTPGYTTTGYVILGLVLAAVTGRPAHEVVSEVAAEAGLADTALAAPADNAMPAPAAHGYVARDGVPVLAEVGVDLAPGTDTTDWQASSIAGVGGGMYSTLGDLFAWAASGCGTSLLPPDVAARRMDLRTKLGGGALGYGLGIASDPYLEGYVGHSGQVVGYEALALHDPDSGGTVAVLVNSVGALGVLEPVLARIVRGTTA